MSARRPWARPFVPLYRAGQAVENALRRAGLPGPRRLGWPVISVGSLSSGGAGKTPVVIALASLLRERGWQVDVLSRGYGRASGDIEQVDLRREGSAPPRTSSEESSNAGQADPSAAQRYGDEPVLIAAKTGVPVWVGADRYAAGWLAESEGKRQSDLHAQRTTRRWTDYDESSAAEKPRAASPQLCAHLLDDGFQHRRLTRDFDIVLVTAEDLEDTLLPAGNLREPLSALRRAHAVVMREEEREAVEDHIRVLTGGELPIWSVRRTLTFPAPLFVFSAGLRPVAFCAIARPEGFAAMVKEAGCGIVETVAYPDHHHYTERDIIEIVSVARKRNGTGFVTTEKDAVKLTPAMRDRLAELGPVCVVSLQADFVYKAPVVRALESKLRLTAGEKSAAAPRGRAVR